jgi:hypothetical protein
MYSGDARKCIVEMPGVSFENASEEWYAYAAQYFGEYVCVCVYVYVCMYVGA